MPASLRSDVSFAFLQAQQARRGDKLDDAVKALANIPRDPALLGDGDDWWDRAAHHLAQALDDGEPAKAYEVAPAMAPRMPAERIDAEWHAGFVALRFLKKADVALKHFDEAAAMAETPISVSRAAYWRGRAYEELGKTEEAKASFSRPPSNRSPITDNSRGPSWACRPAAADVRPRPGSRRCPAIAASVCSTGSASATSPPRC